ncbi:MAG: Phosphoribosylglycinamide formyltransferase [Rhodanobacteraceae bacterium]|jgi:phosphoribosylglycinamide formyltransferase-1|nr:MAG: Phosphoribosylglycinamide formyltransferase [Rhodanobacteraceae bacterium]
MSRSSESRVSSPQSRPFPIAVLASGRGSNLAALIDAREAGKLPIDIVLVASDKADAPALRNAEAHGFPTFALDPKTFASRREFDEALFANVAASGAQLVVLAGYMRILDAAVTAQWQGRMINIHPSLLPKYRGLHTHRRVLKAGDLEHGASVHFVSAELDGGPVIAQAHIDIHPGDTEDALAARLLSQEHRLLVACVGAIARGEVREREGKVLFRDQALAAPLRLGDGGNLIAA